MGHSSSKQVSQHLAHGANTIQQALVGDNSRTAAKTDRPSKASSRKTSKSGGDKSAASKRKHKKHKHKHHKHRVKPVEAVAEPVVATAPDEPLQRAEPTPPIEGLPHRIETPPRLEPPPQIEPVMNRQEVDPEHIPQVVEERIPSRKDSRKSSSSSSHATMDEVRTTEAGRAGQIPWAEQTSAYSQMVEDPKPASPRPIYPPRVAHHPEATLIRSDTKSSSSSSSSSTSLPSSDTPIHRSQEHSPRRHHHHTRLHHESSPRPYRNTSPRHQHRHNDYSPRHQTQSSRHSMRPVVTPTSLRPVETPKSLQQDARRAPHPRLHSPSASPEKHTSWRESLTSTSTASNSSDPKSRRSEAHSPRSKGVPSDPVYVSSSDILRPGTFAHKHLVQDPALLGDDRIIEIQGNELDPHCCPGLARGGLLSACRGP
eukprot:Blabericola_migrator_1__13452@NODE_969_length_5870_cov_76_745476_g671_i0_p2_GENE_NODE_969_length_5870_cov_76_745476_g671_i0NODE_969_length_5870_cov_76_745476_g671_i0_p2_ORF_typecomplete_len427_score53_08_NODE_969_length_5870_cov_76_745476_g671_i031974477